VVIVAPPSNYNGQPPSDYDDAGMLIQVDPNTLYSYATVDMVNEADLIAQSISSIVEIWNNLRLGWAGATADEAHDFNDRWVHAVEGLFGTKDHPEDGAFPQLASAVDAASINYGEAEDTVMKMFQSLTHDLNSPPSTPPPPTRDQNQGPVTESAPPPP